MRRNIFSVGTGIFLTVAALAAIGCSHSGALAGGGVKDDFKPNLEDSKLKDKLGPDDGYSLAVMYGSDIHGSLETCG